MNAIKAIPATVEFVSLSEAQKWRGLLTNEERARADGISNPAVRARFEIGRGLRRRMLADVMRVPPEELSFAESARGKPLVVNTAGWDFNVSHSGDYVAIAIGRGQLGIDLEEIRPMREMESIVDRYFHPDEAAAWHRLAPGLREDVFFVLWSAREAAMKCVGLGLARGLSVTRVDPAILTGEVASARVGDAELIVQRLRSPQGYFAVLAHVAA